MSTVNVKSECVKLSKTADIKNRRQYFCSQQNSCLSQLCAVKPDQHFPIFQCLLCDFKSTCPRKLEEHINRAHFDLTSPSVLGNANANPATLELDNPTLNATLALTSAMALTPGPGTSSYQCPICEQEFSNGSEAEVHVNVEHKDILSPQKPVS